MKRIMGGLDLDHMTDSRLTAHNDLLAVILTVTKFEGHHIQTVRWKLKI